MSRKYLRTHWSEDENRMLKMLADKKTLQGWTTAVFLTEAQKWLPERSKAAIATRFHQLRRQGS